MITISLCMIVKNEEEVIGRCLDSIKDIVDEIIIVDTGSTDKTKEISRKYTNKIFDFKWVNDFSKARNFSFSKATKEYIMWLDADDVILEEDKKKLKELKNTLDNSVDIVMLKYNTGFDENGNVTFSYNRERLLKRCKNYKWISPIHEVIVTTGNILYSDIAITHKKEKIKNPKRNLQIFENMLKNGEKLDPRQQYYYARELYYNKNYIKAIEELNNFLDNKDGWIENKINACVDLYNCYQNINDEQKAFLSLTKSFMYDTPRAEICCKIGDFLFNKYLYTQAIYWYKQATNIKLDISKGGFYDLDCYNFIPYIQLCVCYYKIGDIKESIKYNELAGKIKPTNSSYILNKEFFNNLLNQ